MLDKLQHLGAMIVALTAREKNEKGATATEYGLLVALIAMIIVFGVGMFGTALDGWFQALATTVGGWAP
jgi:pilus assembly protein Flp/PilA